MSSYQKPKPDQKFISDFPHLLKEWDYEKNDKTPDEVRRGSQKKYYWICPEGHSYPAQATHRANSNSGCSVCSGRLVTNDNSLASCDPEVTKLLHPDKNGNLDPNNLHVGSHKIVWWLCPSGHEWKTSVKSLTKLGTRCPLCLKKEHHVIFDPAFQSTFPNLSKMWDRKKNKQSIDTPLNYTESAQFHFKCSEGHRFSLYTPDIKSVQFDGCRVCRINDEKLAWESFCIEKNLYEILHPTKNSVDLNSLSKGSNVRLHWICEYGHEWDRSCKDISNYDHNDCPKCTARHVSDEYNWAVHNPEALKEWIFEKNLGIDPYLEFPNSHKLAWFRCSFGHTWKSTLKDRTSGKGCSKCSNQTSRPELRIFCELKQIFPNIKHRHKIERNEADIYIPTHDVVIEFDGGYFHRNKTNQDLRKKHYFENRGYQVINVRQNISALDDQSICIPDRELTKKDLNAICNKLCKLIPNQQINQEIRNYVLRDAFWNNEFYNSCVSALPAPILENSLHSLAPEVSKQWDFDKNHPLTPKHFNSRSSTKVFWVCEAGHGWSATIASRVGGGKQAGTNCPFCVGNLASDENNLMTQYPLISAEWDWQKNKQKPNDFTPHSKKKAWWRCSTCDNSYEQSIGARTSGGQGCPKCSEKKRTQKTKIPISVSHPHIFDLIIHAEKDIDIKKLTKGSGKKVTIECSCGFIDERRIESLTKPRSLCKSCKKILNST